MDLVAAALAGFLAAALAPIAASLLRRAAGPLLALVPLGLFVYFCTCLPDLPSAGRVVRYVWASHFSLTLSFRLDGLSLLFALLITGIGAIVLQYAGSYLAGDARLGLLYALLLAFMASMLGVVLSDNLFAIFVFWELTSITSYLLIGFDHEREAARSAALKALLVTSGGGLALLAGFILLGQIGMDAGLSSMQAYDLSAWLSTGTTARDSTLYTTVLVLIALGCFTKSAQFPFHFWLPAAMEAPTPVSAYLHSATMVKAGVYLLARMNPVLGGTDAWHGTLMWVGLATMLIGAVLAIQHRDLKQILAYSTVSALGLLVLLVGHEAETAAAAAVTFALAHALYKGALFLVAGAVDHETGSRDVARLSGLRRTMPMTAAVASVAALSMAAIPPLFGFVAKESIYETMLHGPMSIAITGAVMLASALFVVIAMIIGLKPFWGTHSQAASQAHEASVGMWLGPFLLAAGGLLLGLLPTLVDLRLLARSTQAILNEPQPQALKLALWHGFNEAFMLSMLTIAAGVGIYALRTPIATIAAKYSSKGPANVYESSLVNFLKFSEWQTHIIQSGYLRHYLMTILVVGGCLTGYTAFIRDGLAIAPVGFDARLHELAICLLIPISCWAIIRVPSRLAAIVALGVVGYSVALIFVLFGAPDLAMTQFLIETLTVVLFVFAFYRLPSQSIVSGVPARVRDAAIAIMVGTLMGALVLLTAQNERSRELSRYYIAHSVPDAHGRNIVNVILVDFRALDTLGEITVLALAAVGVYSLLKLRPAERT